MTEVRYFECACGREYNAPPGAPTDPKEAFPFECECGVSGYIAWGNVYVKARQGATLRFVQDAVRVAGMTPLALDNLVEDREPVYRCQSPTCGAYALKRHLEELTGLCGCGYGVLQCGDDVAANQYRNIVATNDEYRAENKTLDADVRRLEGRLAEAEKSINRMEAELERVRKAKSQFAAGYFAATGRVDALTEVVNAHLRHSNALQEFYEAAQVLVSASRKAGLLNDDKPLDVDMVGDFGAGDKVRVLVQRFASIPVGSIGEVDSVWPELDSQPIVVGFEGRDVNSRYAFNADELKRVEEDIF